MYGSEKNWRDLNVSNSMLCSSSGDCWILTGSGAYGDEWNPEVEILVLSLLRKIQGFFLGVT